MRARLHLLAIAFVISNAVVCGAAEDVSHVVERGTLRWGGDASGGGPYIYQGPENKLVGFEYELVNYLARQIGLKPEYVNWEWENLPQILNLGKIDVVLNGFEWSAERGQLWASTIPYYVYTLQLMTRVNDTSIKSWDDLRAPPGQPRKRVGVLQGAASERYLETRFGDSIELKKYPEITSVMGLVEQGQLDATVQDAPSVTYYGKDFPGLRVVGEPAAPGYYVAYLRPGDDKLRTDLNAAILKAMADGTLQRIYEKYGVWNEEQKRLPEVAESWPPAGAASSESSRWANMPHYVSLLLRAAWTTIKLSFLSMPLAIAIGLVVAICRLYGPWWIRVPCEAYVELLRGTPLLLQLFVIYYVLPQLTGVTLPEFWAGVLGLAINYSAYEAENYRAGLLAIPRGQMEAALSLGMSTWTALRRVVVPQAVRIVIPPVTNDFIALFKDTSVCSMIAVTELTGMYRFLFQSHPSLMLEFGVLTALLYLLMSYPLSLVARRLETRMKKCP
ncbi:MAG: ABC transporter permease subunit [Pirellulales bacterium]|nr:ABC transporter permease subunit [Pirellulales bacterium]